MSPASVIDPLAEGAERVEALGPDPLAIGELHSPSRNIVETRVSEDVLQRMCLRAVLRTALDDHGEFGFVVDRRCDPRVDPNCVAGTHNRGRELREHEGFAEDHRSRLCRVVRVVQADRDDLPWICDRW